mmetsp:Transcript_17496/g.27078  ORF Transcript_17496/g.27078 Transcript_17496/m.27078 type:complete len:380 (-) Transcript_17496:325-1464(-)
MAMHLQRTNAVYQEMLRWQYWRKWILLSQHKAMNATVIARIQRQTDRTLLRRCFQQLQKSRQYTQIIFKAYETVVTRQVYSLAIRAFHCWADSTTIEERCSTSLTKDGYGWLQRLCVCEWRRVSSTSIDRRIASAALSGIENLLSIVNKQQELFGEIVVQHPSQNTRVGSREAKMKSPNKAGGKENLDDWMVEARTRIREQQQLSQYAIEKVRHTLTSRFNRPSQNEEEKRDNKSSESSKLQQTPKFGMGIAVEVKRERGPEPGPTRPAVVDQHLTVGSNERHTDLVSGALRPSTGSVVTSAERAPDAVHIRKLSDFFGEIVIDRGELGDGIFMGWPRRDVKKKTKLKKATAKPGNVKASPEVVRKQSRIRKPGSAPPR